MSKLAPRFLLGAAMLSLTSCADTPLATDAVQTPDAAIAIAKKACDVSDIEDRRWHVALRNGTWEARGYHPGHSPTCGWKGAKIRASDGFTEGCEACVGG